MKKRILLLAACLFSLTGCATVQDFIALDDRISSLERQRSRSDQDLKKIGMEIQKIGTSWDAKGQDFVGQYAGLRAETKNIMAEIRILNGRLDELEFTIGQLRATKKDLQEKLEGKLDRIDKTSTKNSDRIISMEQYLGLGSKPKTDSKPLKGTGIGKSGEKDSEKELYEKARKAFDEGHFESARRGFQRFVKQHSKSENADNAQFWIGETYYREAWYEKAILEYEIVKKKYSKGNKIPSALLKQGMSFQQLKEKANARLILEELVKKFPKSSEAVIARKVLKEL